MPGASRREKSCTHSHHATSALERVPFICMRQWQLRHSECPFRVPFISTRQSHQRVGWLGCHGVQEPVAAYTATLAGCVHKLLLRYLAGVVGGMDEARGVRGMGALYCMVPQVLMLLRLLVSLEQVRLHPTY